MLSANIPINHCDLVCNWTMFPICPSMTRFVYWIWIDFLPDYSRSIMAQFTNEEYADILYCCRYCEGDSGATTPREYLAWIVANSSGKQLFQLHIPKLYDNFKSMVWANLT